MVRPKEQKALTIAKLGVNDVAVVVLRDEVLAEPKGPAEPGDGGGGIGVTQGRNEKRNPLLLVHS
jgi:hypothetical protein